MSAENGLPDELTKVQKLQWILYKSAEECAEVVQTTMKAARYGLFSVNPSKGLTNAQDIMEEAADAIAIMRVLLRALNLSDKEIVELVELGTAKLVQDYPELFIPAKEK